MFFVQARAGWGRAMATIVGALLFSLPRYPHITSLPSDDIYLIIARDFVALSASFAMIPTLPRDHE
jgi:hypothetical protein